MHVFGLVSVKHGVIIHPECPFTVNLTKVVEVQLPHQTNNIIEKHKNRIDIAENICIAIEYKYSAGASPLKSVVSKVLRKSFSLKTSHIIYSKCFSGWYPLLNSR